MDPTVRLTDDCYLRGRVVHAQGSTVPVYAFLGVPYAQPPVRSLRFKHAQPLKNLWKGTRDATDFGSICPQNSELAAHIYRPFPIPTNQNEDCLNLNVWTPALEQASKKRLPVIVYIHGGSYQYGCSNMHNGTAHAAYKNVVFISINYRLGAFGFLYTGDGAAPGNMGVTDVLVALSWIRTHIAAFGGDPDNVTCMGESSGGMLVSLMMVCPRSKGLFHRAIAQSGVATDTMAWTADQAKRFCYKRLERNGYLKTPIEDMNRFLQAMPREDLIRIYDGGTVPMIDGAIVTEHPRTSFLHGRTHKVPLLIGLTTNDGYGFAKSHLATSKVRRHQLLTAGSIEGAVNVLLMENFRRKAREKGVDRLLMDEYGMRDEQAISGKKDYLLQQLSHMACDIMFGAPTVLAALGHSVHTPVFMYLFDQRPSGVPTKDPEWVRSRHIDDLPFTIGYPFLEPPHPYYDTTPEIFDETEKQFCLDVMSYWTNFAKHGNPNTISLTRWPRFTAGDQQYMVLNKHRCDIQKFYRYDKMQLWNTKLFPLLGYPGAQSKY